MREKKILVLSSEFDNSVDSVMKIATKNGVRIDRFNTDSIPVKSGLSFIFSNSQIQSLYSTQNGEYDLSQYSTFWYRHPGKPIPHKELKGKSRDFVKDESQLSSEGFWMTLESSSFWVSKPSNISLSRYRINQLYVAKKVGFLIPNTIITNRKEDVLQFFKYNKNGIIAKPVGVGIPLKSKDGYNYYEVIFTKKLTWNSLREYLSTIKFCPSIFQEYIRKDIEIRATVVGDLVFACAILSQGHSDKDVKVDWRRVSPDEIIHQKYKLPAEIEKKCVAIVKNLGLEYGAIDLIKNTAGEYIFLEINSDGQYGWVQGLTGFKIDDALAYLLINGNTKKYKIL